MAETAYPLKQANDADQPRPTPTPTRPPQDGPGPLRPPPPGSANPGAEPPSGVVTPIRPDTNGGRGKEPLWRDVLGAHFRVLRHRRGETLTETARRAGVSPQYLSEMERGLKEPSSEMIAAVAGALGVSLVDLTLGVAETLRGGSRAASCSTPTRPTTTCRATYALAV